MKDYTYKGGTRTWFQTLDVPEAGAGPCSPGSVLLLGSRQRNVCLTGCEEISLTPWLSCGLEEEFIILITEVFPGFVVKHTAEGQGSAIILLLNSLEFSYHQERARVLLNHSSCFN